MNVFHGSDRIVDSPKTNVGRENLDFGVGFYVTTLKSQAKKWAGAVAERKGPKAHAVLNEYVFDYEEAIQRARVLRFDAYDEDWLEYVVACRRGENVWQQYDMIEGGVANDNVIDTVEDYENGRMTAEQALNQLRYKKPNHQMCIISQSIIDSFLRFKESTILEKRV